ncbi:NAD(P)H-dependent oxidoreductase [Hyphomonas sp.]|uniref:NAD(P)H-dependent oxidoreductase n=1 Tax=Hyphomonas sp. TaxID=87 RepID=UPI00391CEA00
MILLDTALDARAAAGQPVQVAMFGAGYMGRGVSSQILRHVPGLRLAVICNRSLEKAAGCYTATGINPSAIREVHTPAELDDAISAGMYAVTTDPAVAAAASLIDVTLEATGHVAYGARVTLLSIEHRKPMVSMNAELDATCGAILKHMADEAGIILAGADGDQPVVQMNLVRYVRGLGLKPLICGNIKGLQDRYRTPATQAAFAKQWGQTPEMVTSFADGTKISFEQAMTANSTGMTIARRGMIGLEHRGHVDELVTAYDLDEVRALGGIVDYVVGSQPNPGIFVFAEAGDDTQKIYLDYGKLGQGPVYSFYTAWHLTALEVHNSIGRVSLFGDIPIAPIGAPRVEVVATAKRDLKAGETLDGIGGFMTYGVCETAEIMKAENLVPMGIAEGCVLTRDVPKDAVLTTADISVPKDSVVHDLRARQDAHFKTLQAQNEAVA